MVTMLGSGNGHYFKPDALSLDSTEYVIPRTSRTSLYIYI